MNLPELLRENHSKAQALRIARSVGASKERLSELAAITVGQDQDLARRAAWAVSYCAETHPDLVRPLLGDLLKNLSRSDLHEGVTRNTMKVAAEIGIPDEFSGLAVETAFRVLESTEGSIAARVHAMSVLEHFCPENPELADELRLVIEHLLPYEKRPGFLSKARRVLKSLDRIRR